MAVQAVIFDWGGTLTPWHTIDHEALWLEVCGSHYAADQVPEIAAAIYAAEFALWRVLNAKLWLRSLEADSSP